MFKKIDSVGAYVGALAVMEGFNSKEDYLHSVQQRARARTYAGKTEKVLAYDIGKLIVSNYIQSNLWATKKTSTWLSKKLGISQSAIGNYIKRKALPTERRIKEISRIFEDENKFFD